MRKLLYLLLTLLALGFQSCLKEDEDYFDKTASARLSTTLEAYKSTLEASEYGWALEYYPEENQSYGGYMYAIKFTDDKATVAIDLLGSSTTQASLYRLVGDNGPVLTFDTYNFLMHNFATPSSTRTDGYRGDYEFILLGEKDGVITLKGKKTGNKMALTKLKEPLNTFIDKVGQSRAAFDAVPKIAFTVGSGAVAATKSAAKLAFSYTEGGESKTEAVAYIPTATGIKLYASTTILGEAFQEFTFDNNGLGMTCTTNSKVKITFVYPPVNETLSATTALWKFKLDGSNMSSGLASLLATGKADIIADYGASMTMTSFAIGANPLYPSDDTKNPFAFVTVIGGYYGILGYEMSPVAATTDQVSFAPTYLGPNWDAFSALNPFVLKIAAGSPYKLETDSDKNPSYIKFVSVADPTIWFRVDK